MNLNSLLRTIRKKNLTAATLRRALRKRHNLRVESLEDRAVPATVPSVLSVTPSTGGTLVNNIVVKFSEDVAGAGSTANYSLFAQDGTAIPFTVTYASGPNTATITPSVVLQAGTYSLFIKGDQIKDTDGDNLALARPGEVVVANNNGQNLSTVSLADTHLSAPTTQVLPTQGNTAFQPKAVASADIDGDGLKDLIVAGGNLTFNQVDVFLGKADGGFNNVPAAQLQLPIVVVNNNNFPSNPTAIVATDLNGDGTVDIAVANRDANNVSVFLNKTFFVGDPLTFSPRADYAAGNAPVALVAGRFNNDANVDLAVANATADGSNNFTVNILTNTGTGGIFNPGSAFAVGTSGPSGVTSPTSLAVGNFDGNTLDDLVAGGGNAGLSVMINTSNNPFPSFNITPVNVFVNVTSVATGIIRTGTTASSVDDVIATTASGGGQIVAGLNNGTGSFQPAGPVLAGVASPGSIHLTNLTGDFHPEVQYVNGAAAGGLVARPSMQAGLVADASNTATITITSNNHGLKSGQRVVIQGVQGNTAANGVFYITNVTTNTFDLVNGPAGNGVALPNTGTWVALPGIITGATGTGVSPIVITSPHHGLRTGQQITITGVGGNLAANVTNVFVTVIDADHFSLNGTTGTGAYVANTGTFAIPVDPTGSSPVGLVLADFSPKLDALGKLVLDVNNNPILRDGLPDAVTINNSTNNLSLYTGSPAAGATGDGTFQDSSNLPLATSHRPGRVTVGDLNGDGIPDLVVPVQTSNEIQIFNGLAAGGYNPTPTVRSTGTGVAPISVAIGDVNGDGFPDIAVADRGSSNVAIFLNNGTGTFPATPSTFVPVGNTPTQVLLVDVNEDGVADLITPHNGPSSATRGITLRLGNGDGTFQAATDLLTGGVLAPVVAVGDLNRDGHVDLAVTDDQPVGAGIVHVLKGDGTGKFTTFVNLSTGPNPVDITIADFNADGFQDIATVSHSATTFNHVSVLLSDGGTQFEPARNTTLPSDTPLQSVTAMHLNQDPYMDLVVTSQTTGAGKNNNNVQVLFGVGDGSFDPNIIGSTARGIGNTGTTTLPPSSATVVSDPFMLLSTFDVKSQSVKSDLILNGDFEARTLDGSQGNLDGWTTFNLRDETSGSRGAWMIQSGLQSPLSGTPLFNMGPNDGQFQAMLDQSILDPVGPFDLGSDFRAEGSHALYQDVTIPANAASAVLTMHVVMSSFGYDFFGDRVPVQWSDPASNPQLNYRTNDPNQQVRIDIMAIDKTALDYPLDIGSTVLRNLFQTQLGDPTSQTKDITADMSAYAGQTIRIRVATTNNQGSLIVGVDSVHLQVVSNDTLNPIITSVRLRNPNYLAGPAASEQSTDPTIVGQVSDNLTVHNISKVIFDLGNNGFGGSDDVVVTNFDVNGNFSFTANGLLPGLRTVPVRVVDAAGNSSDTVFSFVMQGPSQTIWQAQGPGPIDTSNQGVNYSTVSGKISGIAVDRRDPSGNTMYISAPNGGVWRTTDGGNDWQALTDNVLNASGQRVSAPIGALGIGNDGVVYAATGVDDVSPASRTSAGILRSADDGRTWTVMGGDVFAGARISKMGVDPRDSNTVYVGVASWSDPTRAPALFKTSDGGVTWTNILDPVNMFDPRTGSLGAGAALASVTDVLVDPFNPGRLIIGLGNIGEVAGAASAGVWKSADGGATWFKGIGGDKTYLANPSTIPDGTAIGRVTLAQGTGRVGDEKNVYVLLSSPIGGTDHDPMTPGASLLGLFKSKDNLLNYTHVVLKAGFPLAQVQFAPIDVFTEEGDTVGAMVVDPSDPNVVYIGGARRVGVGQLTHSTIRVDTGNMRDADYVATEHSNGPKFEYNGNIFYNDGDDIDKGLSGWDPVNGAYVQYPGTNPAILYDHEGVYWYDLEQSDINDFFQTRVRNFPAAVERMATDPQGRVLFGTAGGLYRGLPLGFDYDFTSGGFGMLAVKYGVNPPNPPGMQITDLNGNLQISELTGAAIDPINPDRYYISSLETGTALTPGGVSNWASNGLTGTFNVPDAVALQVATPSPLATADTPTTLYRLWMEHQLVNEITRIPELSADGGITFTQSTLTNNGGIALSDNSPFAPVLAINPTKFFNAGENKFFDELLYGDDRVYLSRSNGNAWDAISGVLSPGHAVSAVAFAPSTEGVYYAGTSDGRFFFHPAGGNFVERTVGLPGARINGITVDLKRPNTVYVMLAANSGPTVFKSNDAGQTWAPLGGTTVGATLPQVSAYTMAIDPRPSSGAPIGRLYVGTDVGAFVTVDGGATWVPLGKGLPAVPVVSLQFSQAQETLVAATQGRGVFTLSTDHSGPAIVDVSPATPTTDGALGNIDVTFNKPVDPRTFTAEGNTPGRASVALSVLTSTGYMKTRINELYNQLLGRAPTKAEVTAALPLFKTANGELTFVAKLLSSTVYFADPQNGNNSNAAWVQSVWQDLFNRTSVGDSLADSYLAQLAALPPTATAAQKLAKRLAITTQLVVTGADTGPMQQSVFDHHVEYLVDRLASAFNRFVARNYPADAGKPGSTVNVSEITPYVTQLLQGTSTLLGVLSTIMSTTEAYQKAGNDIALPPGVTANAVALGNFTKSFDLALGKPILDLAVAGSDNKVYIFPGKVGGGFLTPVAALPLPANASASDLVAIDLDGNGLDDLVVANGGLTAAGANSVSVFKNTSPVGGPISFAARTDLNGGNNPVALVTGDVDGDNKVDIAVADGQVNGSGNFVVNVLLGNGDATFGAPTSFKVGDNIPSAGELTSPTDIAIGNVTGSTRPDLVVSGANGVVVLTNTTATAGTPLFTPLPARLPINPPSNNVGATSVVVAPLNTDTNLDIAVTTSVAGGEVLVFRNDGGGVFVTPSAAAGTVIPVGATPRSLTAGDMNADGRPDLVVAESGANSVSVIFNETVDIAGSPDPLKFDVPITYPVTGSQPTSIALGDVNQDGILDVEIGSANSQFVSGVRGLQQGVLAVPTDPVWLNWVSITLTGATPTAKVLAAQEASLNAKELVYLQGPDGSAAPITVAPTDASDFTYRLGFAPRLLDGGYTLVVGPNTMGVNLKDFGDTDGSFANTGNPMNQNRNAFNGEFPGDRYTGAIAVNHTDDGRFVSALFHDFLGATETNGRDPDNPTFLALVNPVEAARVASLTSVATTVVNSQEEIDQLITGLYTRFLGRVPTSGSPTAELETNRAKIIAKKLTYRTLVVNLLSSAEYFTNAGGTNLAWLTKVYADLKIPQDLFFNRRVIQLNNHTISRATVARLTVYGTAALQQAVTEYFVQFLGRTPVRNADKGLDETTPFVTLLKKGHDEQVIVKLVASAEYLRLNGNNNSDWLKSIYLNVLGRPSIDTSGAEFTGMLATLFKGPLNGYELARQNAVTGPLVLGSQEYRDRKFTDYYIEFLHRAGLTLPSALELAAQEAWYESHGGRLESVAANLFSSAEYLALNGSGAQNQTWLTKIYNDLLDRGINDGTTADQQTAQAQLDYLNSHSSTTAQVQAARFTIAMQVLSSAEYRRFIVAGFLNAYLGENKPTRPAPGDAEIDAWVALMAGGTTQQGILGLMLKTQQFFLLQ